METKNLETFLLVAESGGLTSAAGILGVPQSQVSRHIKALEEQCGVPLLYRNGRGVRLTLAGERLRDSLGPLLLQLQEALADAAAEHRKLSGTVDVALTPTVIRAIGLLFIDAMAHQYPGVRVRLLSGNSRYIYEWIHHAQVDVGVFSDADMPSQLLQEDLGTTPVVLAALPGFPIRSEGTVAQMLDGLPLRLPSRGTGLRRQVDAWAAKHGIKLDAAYEIDDIDIARDIILAGRAAALMSRLSVARELDEGTFVEHSLGDDIRVTTVLATARSRPITPAMKATISTLKAVATPIFR
ncbi:MAG: LysR family transcriptional regulator [Polaromonas sp.]|nr:LysR family transcriptional regulator [Polaromonas sp.]